MSRALLWVLAGCSGAMPGPGADGGAADVDGDGWAPLDGDCDDADPAAFPGALDRPGDGVDSDCDGEDAEVLEARGLQAGELVVTEVQTDPVGVPGSLGEWFELRNDSGVPVDLEGIVVRDDGGEELVVLDPVVVEPGDHVVLGAHPDEATNGGVPVDYAYGGELSMGGADELVVEVELREIDAVRWDNTFPIEDGRSLSLTEGAGAEANDTAGAWCAADALYGVGGWGTPGAPNDPCPPPLAGVPVWTLDPGDLVITEVMQNPDAVSDGLGEWIEVFNASGLEVQLQDLELESGGEDFSVSDALALAPNDRVVIGATTDTAANGGAPVDLAWGTGTLTLGNGTATLVLGYGTLVLDEIRWDNGVTFPDPQGASMALEPGADAVANDAGSAWCEGATPYGDGDLGTPGAANLPCP